MKTPISEIIVKARIDAGYLTPYAFCKATGFPKSTLKGWEDGKASPSYDGLEEFADAIGWEVIVVFQPRPKPKK